MIINLFLNFDFITTKDVEENKSVEKKEANMENHQQRGIIGPRMGNFFPEKPETQENPIGLG